MNFSESPEFAKEFKGFAKKWRSLKADLDDVKLTIEKLYTPQEGVKLDEFRELFFSGKRAAIIYKSNTCEVVKMRLHCASLSKKELMRLIFVFTQTARDVTFIELYAKNEKSREDKKRIKKYIQ
ncbi:MAG: hypothetical protein LBU20_01920 [Candidatus Nomurabacteria bacterium]|jgi:hypothetical protein|nr:hypothetical protein [Candidatus Nomurabacteria bacterium]